MMSTVLRLSGLVVALALIGGSGCGKETDPTKSLYWVQRLDDPDQQSKALQKLGSMKAVDAIPELTKRFEENEDLRAPIATTLGMIGDTSIVPTLIKGLNYKVGSGSDKRSRTLNRANSKIVEALGMLKATEGVQPIIKMLGSPNPYVRKEACRALGAIGDARAVPELNRLVKEDENMNIRRTAVEALGDIGDPGAIPVLLRAMFIEQGASLYPFASFAMFQIGKPAVQPLSEVLRGKHAEINKLAEQLNFEHGALQIKAIEVLGDLRPAELEDEFVAMFKKYDKMKDEDFPLRQLMKRNIAMALEKFGSDAAGVVLADAILKEEDFTVREFYSLAVNHVSNRSVVPKLLKAAEKGDADSRRVVIRAYTQLGTGDDLEALEKFAAELKTPKPELADAVRRITEREKVRLIAHAECKTDKVCWQKKLSDKNPRVREKAAYELGRLGAVDMIDDLIKATADEDEDARRAGIWAMFKLNVPKGIEFMEQTLLKEKGKPDYIRINEELKRLVVYLKWSLKKGA